MTRNHAALFVQVCIVSALVALVLAPIKPIFWFLLAVCLFAGVQFGHLHNTGRFLGSKKAKLSDSTIEGTVAGHGTVVPLHGDPVELHVEDRSSIA
jgi:hypothetical protein